MIILNANDHGEAQALSRLITRFPDIIDHGIPGMGTRAHAIGDSPFPGWSDSPDLNPDTPMGV